jgi:NADPH:quinone reductase-like Zn-dependent oxidoreductase
MPHRAKAWFLYPGSVESVGQLAELVQEEHELRDLVDGELLVEPLYGSWGGNMTHALLRKPIDVCRQRGEPRVALGNAAVVRVLTGAPGTSRFRSGQVAMLFAASVVDRWGYPEKMLAYDAPGTVGCLSTRMIVREHELVALPQNSRHSLPQWAAFSGNYVTAWSNWEQAYGSFRLLVPADELPAPYVFGWGGGTTLAELDLARRHGCQTFMLSSSEARLSLIAQAGITPIDRRPFHELYFDERRFAVDAAWRRAYLDAEAAFLREVEQRTAGLKVQIFVDYIGTPLLRATLKALGRQGILTSAGWREGMAVAYLRAAACIGRHQYVHTHYARYAQGVAAVAYAEAHGWLPTLDARIYAFDEVPELARRAAAGEGGFFTAFAINPL